MKKKLLNTDLHTTRGTKDHTKYGLTDRVVEGEGFSRKANMRYKYQNFNQSGKTNFLEYII